MSYQNMNLSLFSPPAPSEINVTAPAFEQILVEWLAPDILYPPHMNLTNSTEWSYVINCTSANAPTITGLVGNTTDLSILFESEDGVQYGTDYICTIRLTYSGNTSVEGRGIPITTLENVASTNLTESEGLDISLQIIYYDFSGHWKMYFDYATKTLKGTTPTMSTALSCLAARIDDHRQQTPLMIGSGM
eukprot:XP_011665783.1 PREDICTED: uncharacterized protein LOC105439011 [Strongylocentrotus purpuratus]